MRQWLTADERARLAVMASVVQFKKGEVVYREGDRSGAIFSIISGVVSSYKKVPGGGEHIVAFLLSDDLFGLCEEGRYINSTKAIVPVTAYSLPVIALTQVSFAERRARISRHLQALPRTGSSAASCVSVVPERHAFEIGDVPATH
jgi:CRP-like cAMP-binding protein